MKKYAYHDTNNDNWELIIFRKYFQDVSQTFGLDEAEDDVSRTATDVPEDRQHSSLQDGSTEEPNVLLSEVVNRISTDPFKPDSECTQQPSDSQHIGV